MEQRFSLQAAGKLFGITTNAMRARAKKYPAKYRIERDNGGKIWVWLDPETAPTLKTSMSHRKGATLDEMKASIEAFKVQTEEVLMNAVLQERIRGLEELVAELRQVSDDMRADRDHWRSQAQRGILTRLFGKAA